MLSRTNTVRTFERRLQKVRSSEEMEKIMDDIQAAIDFTEDSKLAAELESRLSKAYAKKSFSTYDLEKAAYHMRESSKVLENSRNDLFDILWSINTDESLLEMVYTIYPLAKSGNPESMGRLARAYRDGKGVSKSLNNASIWMKKAADSGCEWAKHEYFGILNAIGTEESLKEMVAYGEEESSKGNLEVRARLARAYRDGEGVEKDLLKAADLMESSLDGGPSFCKREYIGILMDIGTKESDKKAFDYARSAVQEGDGDAMMLLASM